MPGTKWVCMYATLHFFNSVVVIYYVTALQMNAEICKIFHGVVSASIATSVLKKVPTRTGPCCAPSACKPC